MHMTILINMNIISQNTYEFFFFFSPYSRYNMCNITDVGRSQNIIEPYEYILSAIPG